MKKRFAKIMPDRQKLEQNSALRPIAHLLANPRIWYFNRRSIAAGIAIGFFFGSLPIIGQMLLSAIVAIAMRVNMPIAVVSTFISNPFTMPFFYTANYYFGAWLLNMDTVHLEDMDFSWEVLQNLGGNILVPLFFGSIVVGVILAAAAFGVIRLWWRLHVVGIHRARIKLRDRLTHRKPKGDA
ncbi:MAG: hypothetical protein CR974_03700 [Gammaproteobacteria bacterium]|nr:MAG: hypothetical protein CR974_03700 [Gammaproteobacteria bacterium]